jgi:AcrR family transcriptional regulator
MVINVHEPVMSISHIEHEAMPILAPGSKGSAKLSSLGRRQRHAAETRLRLFRRALQLFAERGYSNVTVEDITEAADVGKGTFFNYFKTKDHVLGVMAEIQLGKVAESLAMAADGKQTIHFVLHYLFMRVAEEPGRSPDLARTLISSFLANEGVRKLIALNLKEKGRKMIAEIVSEGQKRGEIDPSLKKEEVAIHALQVFFGTVLIWSLYEKPALNVLIENSFQHFWRSIAISGKGQA